MTYEDSYHKIEQKMFSQLPLTYQEILSILDFKENKTEILDQIVFLKVEIDEMSEQPFDYLQKLFINCLLQKNINSRHISSILTYVLEDGEPAEVFPYWWEVIELAIDSQKIDIKLLSTLNHEILLGNYEEDVLPEMQIRLLKKVVDNYSLSLSEVSNVKSKIDLLEEILN